MTGMTGRRRREPAHEVELQIVCGWPGQPDHGEQLLIWAAMDHLTEAAEGIYLKGKTDDAWRWHGVKGPDGFIRPADYSAKLDPRCKRCPTQLRITAERLAGYLDAMRRHSGGKPWKLKVEYRELDRFLLK
jgi:hypothetical protein